MAQISRFYTHVVAEHLATCRQMAFLAGPRQVGKTTLSKEFLERFEHSMYINWDNPEHRAFIQKSFEPVTAALKLNAATPGKRLLVLDELHKYPLWKNWLKGIFDTYEDKLSILVTGSALLNVYRAGQDSMMGRYFLYRIHPLSVAELLGKRKLEQEITPPSKLSDRDFDNLLTFGGFPEPCTAAQKTKYNRWSKAREQLLFKEDLRDLTNIKDLAGVRLLASLLAEQAGKNTSHSSLASKVQVTHPTIKEWIETLHYLYYCFAIKPWSKNIARSLIKEPKYYLWDWSQVHEPGSRKENFIASHLLKAVHHWTDSGLGTYDLYYLRDKDKREVDFLITKDRKPWFLVEVKTSNHQSITPSLRYFQQVTQAPHAFQVVFDEPYAHVDCFSYTQPIIVSAKTLLSQLV